VVIGLSVLILSKTQEYGQARGDADANQTSTFGRRQLTWLTDGKARWEWICKRPCAAATQSEALPDMVLAAPVGNRRLRKPG